ncbi:FAD-binding oxidoreductase [Rhizobium leguminosarum]|nr:FAD-binding oxidoreductase [Rhizobium leguminosarum]
MAGCSGFCTARRSQRIIENCAVRALDIAGGRVAGVCTEHGKIATSIALVAGGAWSSLLLRKHGVSIPQLSVRATVAATEPLPEFHAGAAIDDDIAFSRRHDGGTPWPPVVVTFCTSAQTRSVMRRNIFRRYSPTLWAPVIFPQHPRAFQIAGRPHRLECGNPQSLRTNAGAQPRSGQE